MLVDAGLKHDGVCVCVCQKEVVVEVSGVPCWVLAHRRWQQCHHQGGSNINATMHRKVGFKDI